MTKVAKSREARQLVQLIQEAYLYGAEVIRSIMADVVQDESGNPVTRLEKAVIGQLDAAANGNAAAFRAVYLAAFGSWPETINIQKKRGEVIEQARNAGMLENPVIRALIFGVDGDTITNEPAQVSGAGGTPEYGGTTHQRGSGEEEQGQPEEPDVPEDVSG